MKNKIFVICISLAFVCIILSFFLSFIRKSSTSEITREIKPVTGTIDKIISTTGTVLPKNRLEIKPPVNGRVDSILVKEGEIVKSGQTLAWMSSTERAAVLDAARGQGAEALKFWKDAYKPIPLLASIDGEVIVATTQPGQTVTTADAVVVLSDQLIARAQVDETDIGHIKLKLKAIISLDAYPNEKIAAIVEHIYYESKTVNNVTIYEVDLIPEKVPPFFRSGMNATIEFVVESKENILTLPVEAVHKEKEESFVLLKKGPKKEPVKHTVTVGISDNKNIEILSGLTKDDLVIIKTKRYALPSGSSGTNPFMPGRRR